MGFLYSQLFVTPRYPNGDFTGQTVIVTGANTGLGLEAAKHFARLNASKVILACRDTTKADTAAKQIVAETKCSKERLEIWQLDLSSYKSILAFAEKVDALPRLDAVVENAGIVTAKFQLMENNESSVHVNVIATILLGLLVLPKLRESAKTYKQDGRLVLVGSEVYMWAKFKEGKQPGSVFDNLSNPNASDMADRYNVSKLVQLFAYRTFAAQSPPSAESPVIITALTPGFCKSEVFRDEGLQAKIMRIMQSIIGRTTEVGSRTLVDAASLQTHGREAHGTFLWDCKPTNPKGYVTSTQGQQMQRKVWSELVEKLEGVSPGVTSVLLGKSS